MSRLRETRVFKDLGFKLVEMGVILVVGVVVVVPMFLWAGKEAANKIQEGVVNISAAAPREAVVQQRLKKQFPKVKIASVDCQKFSGLCEFVAGSDVYYTDAKARFLFVGRVYDPETRADLTGKRREEMSYGPSGWGRP